jgi:hypothetical protein
MTDKKIIKKVDKKEPVKINRTREEIEELFSSNLGCDCSSCPYHCGQED